MPSGMDERDSYFIDFRLAEPDEARPSEFRSLFTAIDELTRYLVVEQVHSFVEMADAPDRAREEIYAQGFRLARFIAPPVNVTSIRRESPWTVEVGLPVAAVIWVMSKMIAPEVLKAWNESKLQESFRLFVRDYIFMGAKESLERTATSKPQYGNLVVDDISQTGRNPNGEPKLRVTLRRSDVVSVEVEDHALRDEFTKRMGLKRDE
jgi:hypothetical protein